MRPHETLALLALLAAACTPPPPKPRVVREIVIQSDVGDAAAGPELELHFVDDDPLFADATYRGADDDWPIGLSVDAEPATGPSGEPRARRFLAFHPAPDETITTASPRLFAWTRTRKLPPGRVLYFGLVPDGYLHGFLIEDVARLTARDVAHGGFVAEVDGTSHWMVELTPRGARRYADYVLADARGRRVAFTVADDVFAVVEAPPKLENNGFSFAVLHAPKTLGPALDAVPKPR